MKKLPKRLETDRAKHRLVRYLSMTPFSGSYSEISTRGYQISGDFIGEAIQQDRNQSDSANTGFRKTLYNLHRMTGYSQYSYIR
ncbi:MAG: hypothetical protein ABFS03_13410 [Chloroflexota bacterium]